MRPLTVDDLTERGRTVLEEEYQKANRRARCSRDDFHAGFLAAMVRFRVSTHFTDEAWSEREDEQ